MMALMLGVVTPLGRLIEGLSQLDAVLSTELVSSHPISPPLPPAVALLEYHGQPADSHVACSRLTS